MQQIRRIEIANDTLEIIKRGNYTNQSGLLVDIKTAMQQAVDGTLLFTPAQLQQLADNITGGPVYETAYEVTNETTLDALRRLVAHGENHTVCLNFASAKNPGGGFLGLRRFSKQPTRHCTLISYEPHRSFCREIQTDCFCRKNK